MVRGASFNSMRGTGIVSFGFSETTNDAVITIKNTDGALAGPLWSWKIDSDGILVFFDGSDRQMTTLELIEFSDDEVIVRGGEKAARFKRTKR